MYEDNFKIQPGQIWEVNIGGGKVGKVVVIAVQSNFANTMSIWEADIPANFPLVAGGNVDTRRMVYTNFDNFRCMIDSVSESELAEIKRRFAESIGLIGEPESEPSQTADVRLIVAERERDIWKSVAQSLMGR